LLFSLTGVVVNYITSLSDVNHAVGHAVQVCENTSPERSRGHAMLLLHRIPPPENSMIKALLAAALLAAVPASAIAGCDDTLLDTEFRPLAGKSTVNLCERFGGQVLLVVNTASKCGFTRQYEGLEALHARLHERGFSVVGFPSNDFMGQEPGTEEDIKEFCTNTYGVQFPMFEKVTVTEGTAVPFYRSLAEQSGGTYPGWNFHKYLIGRDGKVVANFGSRTTPDDPALVEAIEAELAKSPPAP
jgi:glutathione peroxidase